MSKLDFEREKDAVDVITNSMFALSFLCEISKVIFSGKRDNVTVGQFYDSWLSATKAKDVKIPYNLGAIMGYLFCGLLLTKENWFELVPNDDVSALDQSWGLGGVNWQAPKCKSPTLSYLIRRVRNALGHSLFQFNFPKEQITPENVHDKVSITFKDENQRDPDDTFQVTLTLSQLQKLVKKLQSLVHNYVRSK